MKSRLGALNFAKAARGDFRSIFGFQRRRRYEISNWKSGSASFSRSGGLLLHRKRVTRSCRTLRPSARLCWLQRQRRSSIMGIYAPGFVAEMKSRGILWFATATTVAEAKAAEVAGADAIIAQGMEAGGHRGAFHAEGAERQMVALLGSFPQIAGGG